MRARSDGNWWADGQAGVCYRFQTVLGHRYLIGRALSANGLYWAENPMGEWLPPLVNAAAARMDGAPRGANGCMSATPPIRW